MQLKKNKMEKIFYFRKQNIILNKNKLKLLKNKNYDIYLYFIYSNFKFN